MMLKKVLNRRSILKRIIVALLTLYLFFSTHAETAADTPKARSDSHAPIGVMGDHAHKKGEVMLAYRFMAMDMRGLQSGTTIADPSDVLKDFMMIPTSMQMYMHMFGGMFAPHDKITLMAMTSYQQRQMEMEGADRHIHGDPKHPPAHHKMSSEGMGDMKLEGLLTLWKIPDVTILFNAGVSIPTGSIEEKGENGDLFPYPMQLGSGSFEARPGFTLFGYHENWSYGSQMRSIFPLHTNTGGYRHGNVLTATAWGARQIKDWISFSGRLLFSHKMNIHGSHPDLHLKMSPNHRPDFRGGTTAAIAFSSNLMATRGLLAGQRIALECILPVYQNLSGIQLKNRWRLILGWQYAFHL